MSHNITIRADGRATMAFRGDRADIWHRLGNQHQDSWTIADWADNSDLAWQAHKMPALVDLSTLKLSPSNAWERMRVANRWFVCRGDNGNVLSEGTVTDQYQIAQPAQILEFFQQYVSVDPRFQLDTAMSLKGGQLIAVTATFQDQTVAGEKHKARLLCTTAFDGTGATLARGLMTRVVCNNTLDAGIAEKDKSVIRVRHSTKFDPKVAGAQLATIVQAFDKYRAMGEAMAKWHTTQTDVSKFFKLTLDIPTDAKREDISTAKFNQFEKMVDCYQIGVRREGLEANSGWAMLQGVTRYVDHEKTVRGSDGTQRGDHETRLLSANFGGSGAVMKQKAIEYLNDMSDGALLKAVASVTAQSTATRRQNDDVAAILAQPLRRSW